MTVAQGNGGLSARDQFAVQSAIDGLFVPGSSCAVSNISIDERSLFGRLGHVD
jgi:hypothetical protein